MTSENWVAPDRVLKLEREAEQGAAHSLARVRAQRVRARRLLAIVDRIEAASSGDDPHARAVVTRLRSIADGSRRVASSPDCVDDTDAGVGCGVGKP